MQHLSSKEKKNTVEIQNDQHLQSSKVINNKGVCNRTR